MIRAYNISYLDDAMINLGEAMDYAANRCDLSMDEFMNFFIVTGRADMFGNGSPRYVAGMSGTELAMDVLEKAGIKIEFPEPQTDFLLSPQY